MNHLKHSLHNIAKLVANEIAKGNIECYECIHTTILTNRYIKSTIYEKDEVGVYIVEEPDWFSNGDDEYYDSYTCLYIKGIPNEDICTIENAVKQMLSVRK